MNKLSILITSVGRRSQLIDCFRKSFAELNLEGCVFGADVSPDMAPAAHLVDRCFRVPRCTDSTYVEAILEICREFEVSVIVPTIDPELPIFSKHRERLCGRGIQAIISGPQTVKIASDKRATNLWLRQNGLPTVEQCGITEALDSANNWRFPVIAKPPSGSASIGVRVVSSESMLRMVASEDRNLLVEERALGSEYTVNIFVNSDGRCISAVPHRRIETRGGEVSKAITVRHEKMIDLAKEIGNALPDAYGPLNIQCFLSPDGEIKVTEINARFGGGYPLAHRAGAKFTQWIILQQMGIEVPECCEFRDGLTMLRYDDAVFIDPSDAVH